MNIYKNYEKIYGLDKNNKIKVWYASIFNDEMPYVIIYHGFLNGKIQENKILYSKGKNIGKKNETTALKQCEIETNKKWLDKQEKENYKLSIDECNQINLYLPMLAQTYVPNNKKNNVKFPCYVQPKLDGCRCIIYLHDNSIKCQSRTGSFFSGLTHIEKDLEKLFKKYPTLILDGELFTFELPFEQMTGLIKTKKNNENQDVLKIKYHIYDIVNQDDYSNRYNFIQSLFQENQFQNIELVETKEIVSEKEILEYHKYFINKNYEGIIIRNCNGKYLNNYRSIDLLKYKTFIEKEYEIVNFKQGQGRDLGCIIWICKTDSGKEFSVRPKGDLEMRKKLFNEGHNYIGKKLTVIYQELSEYDVPRFPVGKDIRINY
jgi:DNA ligase-1